MMLSIINWQMLPVTTNKNIIKNKMGVAAINYAFSILMPKQRSKAVGWFVFIDAGCERTATH